MAWKKVDSQLVACLEQAVADFPAEHKQMFGCPTWFVQNNMWCGVHGEGIMLRLAEADRQDMLQKFPEARTFEPMPGRVMREYLILPQKIYGDAAVLQAWLQKSFQFVAAMPVKVNKKK